MGNIATMTVQPTNQNTLVHVIAMYGSVAELPVVDSLQICACPHLHSSGHSWAKLPSTHLPSSFFMHDLEMV